jgi:hypothetical protein
MSFLQTVKNLFHKSEDVRTAAELMVQAMAAEAIKSGDPEQLMHVAFQWEQLQDGTASLATVPAKALNALPAADITTADEMKPVIVTIMQEAYLGGIDQMTNGTIKKQLDRVKQASGGWKDGDVVDCSDAPGIQPLWWRTLSQALREMRASGEVRTDPVNYRTYSLGAHLVPALPAGTEIKQLASSWEAV